MTQVQDTDAALRVLPLLQTRNAIADLGDAQHLYEAAMTDFRASTDEAARARAANAAVIACQETAKCWGRMAKNNADRINRAETEIARADGMISRFVFFDDPHGEKMAKATIKRWREVIAEAEEERQVFVRRAEAEADLAKAWERTAKGGLAP